MCNASLMYATQAAVAVAGAVAGMAAEKSAAKTNAKIASNNAEAAQAQAAADEAMQRRAAAKVIGQSKVDYLKAGGVIAGTPLDMLAQQTAEAELDAQKIRYGGAVEASQFVNEAKIARQRGKAAGVSAGLNSADALLSGYTAWSDYDQKQKLLTQGIE